MNLPEGGKFDRTCVRSYACSPCCNAECLCPYTVFACRCSHVHTCEEKPEAHDHENQNVAEVDEQDAFACKDMHQEM